MTGGIIINAPHKYINDKRLGDYMKTIRILRGTCTACPMRYEGWTMDNYFFQIYYRGGQMSVRLARKKFRYYGNDVDYDKNENIFSECKVIYSETVGDEHDGWLEKEKVMECLKDVFNFKDAYYLIWGDDE